MDEITQEKEKILELIDEIKSKGTLVVVEGEKDKRALMKLGIENIMTLSKPLYAVVEDIAQLSKEAVILVDLDAEGKKIYHKLYTDLMTHKVKTDDRLRKQLFKTPVRHIEGLATYLQNNS